MPRPSRNVLKFNEDSVNKLLQEIYNDSHNIKAKIVRLFTKWEQKVKEGGEIQAIGDQIVKLISAEAKNQDQKIMLLKYLKDVVFLDKNSNKSNDSDNIENHGNPSSDRRNELLSMVRDELNKKNNK